jgi:hypothetical protein
MINEKATYISFEISDKSFQVTLNFSTNEEETGNIEAFHERIAYMLCELTLVASTIAVDIENKIFTSNCNKEKEND